MTEEETLSQVSSLVQSFPLNKREDMWRCRNTEQILDDRYCTGCTDSALIFMHFAEALAGVPTIYVETIKKESLQGLNFLRGKDLLGNLEGHVFCDAIIGDKLVPFDPSRGKTEVANGSYIRDSMGKRIEYEVLGKGTDYTQVYLKQGNVFEKTPVSLQTKEEIKQAIFKVFAKK
jgi:hypothetical protein